MTATVGDLLERGILAAPEGRWRIDVSLDGIVPESIRQLAQQQLDRLAPRERRVLDAASTVGIEFAVATVAAASGITQEEVEDTCATLAGRNQSSFSRRRRNPADRSAVSGSQSFSTDLP
jgi:predicted ATPase